MRHWKRRWESLKQAKVLSLTGLAAKAGKLASGEFCTEGEVKSGRASLVIVAEDASGNTKKKFQNMCEFYQVPIRTFNEEQKPVSVKRLFCEKLFWIFALLMLCAGASASILGMERISPFVYWCFGL